MCRADDVVVSFLVASSSRLYDRGVFTVYRCVSCLDVLWWTMYSI